MIFAQDRQALRCMFLEAWRKARAGAIMQPLEAQIAEVVEAHPEYHAELEREDEDVLDRDYPPERGEVNPFLHMALHIAVREQLSTDRPPGIRNAFNALLARMQDRHAAEHATLECLAETLWEAQRAGIPPDEAAYLERVRRLTGH